MLCFCTRLRTRSYAQFMSEKARVVSKFVEGAPPSLGRAISISDPEISRKKRHLKPLSKALRLIETYPNTAFHDIADHWRLKPDSFISLVCGNDVLVNLCINANKISQSRDTTILMKRTLCVALTELHNRNTSVDDLVFRVCRSKDSYVRYGEDVRKKISENLKTGTKWKQIMEICARANTQNQDEKNGSIWKFSGIVWLLDKGYVWERANEDTCTKAIAGIIERTNLLVQSMKLSCAVNEVLRYLKANISFSPQSCSSSFGSETQLVGVLTDEPRNNSQFRETSSSQSTISKITYQTFVPPEWKTQSEVAVLQAVPQLRDIKPSGITLLLVLLCFFEGSQITRELLFRGSTPQRRWSQQGDSEEEAPDTGLHPDLGAILSDLSELGQKFDELERALVIRRDSSTGMTTIDCQIVTLVTDGLSDVVKTFWKHQALLIACHGFPRKYLEPEFRKIGKLQLPHLQHTLREFAVEENLKTLSNAAQTLVILSLVEASRFSSPDWKRQAIAIAKKCLYHVDGSYPHACVAQRESMICRVHKKDIDPALALSSFVYDDCQHELSPRMNAELGQLALQSAINHVQNEDLSEALKKLRTWQPMDVKSLSKAERIVLYHLTIWEGKILRYQGHFTDSFRCFQKALVQCDHESSLEDARPSSIRDLGDAYCELEKPQAAECILKEEFGRLGDRGAENSKDWNLLQLSYVESLMGQGRLQEAEALCLKIQPSPSLSKLDSLRLLTLFGRIYYEQSVWDSAFTYWNKALAAVREHPFVNGHTTVAILHSTKEVLFQLGQDELRRTTENQINEIQIIKPDGCKHWIPGLERWHCSHIRPSQRR